MGGLAISLELHSQAISFETATLVPNESVSTSTKHRECCGPAEVKKLKLFVGETLPNNPLTVINKTSFLLDGGKCDSNSHRRRRQTAKTTQSIGRARADCLAALRALDRGPT